MESWFSPLATICLVMSVGTSAAFSTHENLGKTTADSLVVDRTTYEELYNSADGTLETFYHDKGVPLPGVGTNGDVYYDTLSNDYYIKIDGSWIKQ